VNDCTGGSSEGPSAEAGPRADAGAEEAASSLASLLAGIPKLVGFSLRMRQEDYAVLEQAINLMCSQAGRRLSREDAITALARLALGGLDSRGKVRHQLLIFMNGETGEACLDTDRGFMPAPPEVVEEAMADGHILLSGAEEEDDDCADQQLSLLPEAPSSRKKGSGRSAIPLPVLRAVFARAGGRCQDCGYKRGPFHVHHPGKVSKGATNHLSELKLVCRSCHHGTHEQDLATNPEWRRARDAAMRKQKNGTPKPGRGAERPPET